MIIWLIIACEISFWLFILAGLSFRYLLKKPKTGMFLLGMTPLIDLVLLIVSAIDMYRGAAATTAHAIAAVYIGISAAFGKAMINWADQRFVYYLTGKGKKPEKLYGMEHAKKEVKGWLLHLLAFIIGGSLLGLTILLIGDASRTEALFNVLRIWAIVLGIDFVISISYLLFPRKKKQTVS